MAQLKLVQKPAQVSTSPSPTGATPCPTSASGSAQVRGTCCRRTHPNTTRLDLYVRRDQSDHLTTDHRTGTSRRGDSGYDYRGTLGWVSSVDGPGLLPLKLYYHRGKRTTPRSRRRQRARPAAAGLRVRADRGLRGESAPDGGGAALLAARRRFQHRHDRVPGPERTDVGDHVRHQPQLVRSSEPVLRPLLPDGNGATLG